MAVAYIGLGSNLAYAGRMPEQLVQEAMAMLASAGPLVARSSLYRTSPVGYAEQPAFTNAVAAIASDAAPEHVLEQLLAIERRFGRDRRGDGASFRNGPRTLDLDLLLLGERVLATERLTLPHARLAERRFVLQPLAEIAPGLLHPVLGKTMEQLLRELADAGENRMDAVVRL